MSSIKSFWLMLAHVGSCELRGETGPEFARISLTGQHEPHFLITFSGSPSRPEADCTNRTGLDVFLSLKRV